MFFCVCTHRNRLPFCNSFYSCLFHYLSLFPLSPALFYLSSFSPTSLLLSVFLKTLPRPTQSGQWRLLIPAFFGQTYSIIINYSDSTGLYDTCSHYRVEHAQAVLTLTKHLVVTQVYVLGSWMVKVHETSDPAFDSCVLDSVFSVLSGAVCISSLSLFWHQSIHASSGAERYQLCFWTKSQTWMPAGWQQHKVHAWLHMHFAFSFLWLGLRIKNVLLTPATAASYKLSI